MVVGRWSLVVGRWSLVAASIVLLTPVANAEEGTTKFKCTGIERYYNSDAELIKEEATEIYVTYFNNMKRMRSTWRLSKGEYDSVKKTDEYYISEKGDNKSQLDRRSLAYIETYWPFKRFVFKGNCSIAKETIV